MVPIGSYAAVLYASLFHLEEARIILMTHDADGSMGIAALLRLMPNRYALAGMLVASAVLALVTVRDALQRRLSTFATVALLVPQQALLLTTSLSAWCAVLLGVYADGVHRPSAFIETDQMPRGMFSILHLTALAAIAFYLSHKKRS